MRVFGSRARRDARPDSDLDIFLLLDHATASEREHITDLSTDLMLEGRLSFPVSARILTQDQYQRLIDGERLFPQEIARDGIPL